MVFLCCKKGVTGVQIYPETIPPSFLLDCVALPSPPALSGKAIQLEEVKWLSASHRKSRGSTYSMAKIKAFFYQDCLPAVKSKVVV